MPEQTPDKKCDVPGKIKAVLFDLGETLLNFGKINTRHLFRQSAVLTYEFLQRLGQPVGNFTVYRLHSMLAVQMRCLLSNLTGRDFDALSLLKKIGDRKGFKLSEDQWRELGWLWYQPLSNLARIEPKIKETLTSLKEMGLRLGIVSNTFVSASSLDRHLKQLGILDFFAFRFYSYQFDFRKPNVRLFEIAADRIGEPPENILFVGDRIDKDIEPALKVNMTAVLKSAYTNISRKTPAGVQKINRLSELPALIKKINKIGE